MRVRDDPAGVPPATGELVGREWELDRVGALLMGPARLVTLIGSGGIGKTRLAEEAARRLQRARRTPVFLVRLARLPTGSDAATVKEAVMSAVLLEGFVGASAWDGAVQRLAPLDAAGRAVDTLLVLDNSEHVRAGAGTVITDLLEAVAGLTILATSREPLGWVDEQLVTVPPLSVKQSLELFRQRAELAGQAISEPGKVAFVERICRHMHGNPLCIRLAAARMFYEPLSIILEQLSGESDDMRMRWRHGPRVGSEGRHRTIGDVIAWSYELCEDKERLLFDRLSVFAPGYDINPNEAGTAVADLGAELEAIEVICADDVSIPGCEGASSGAATDQGGPAAVGLARTEVHELLEQLVERSLVSVHITADRARYFLLESLRLFASARLAERYTAGIDESARLAWRHCCYYRNKIMYAQTLAFSPAEQELLFWASGAWSNIQRAIDTSMAAGKAIAGLQIAVGVMSLRALFVIGSLSEIRGRVEQTLAATEASGRRPTELFQVGTIAALVPLALAQGRTQDAEQLLERCVATSNTTVAHRGEWRDRPEADIGLPAMVDYAWGVELMWARRDRRAITVLARAREKLHSVGYLGGEAICELFEAIAAGFYGSAEQAMTICERHLERTTAAGAGFARSWAQLALAITLTKHGDVQEALRLGRAALTHQVANGDHWGSCWAVHARMWSLARLIGDQIAAGNTRHRTPVKLATEIAYLAGGAKTQRTRLGMVQNMGPLADETRAAEQVARDLLGQHAYAYIEKRGSQLSPALFEPQRLALGTLSVDASPVERDAGKDNSTNWLTLSKAEREVAFLAAAGWSNSAIGMRRGTSNRTIDAQISSIFQKLEIKSRDDIAEFVPRDQRNRISNERSRIPGHN